jgi:hypothetical protein
MAYKDSNQLYIDFMLDRISKDEFLCEIVRLEDMERKKLFAMSKMQIFKAWYEAGCGE